MLGVRRATVTLAAGALQRAGLAIFRRGLVTIPDPVALEEAACECYRVLGPNKRACSAGLRNRLRRCSGPAVHIQPGQRLR